MEEEEEEGRRELVIDEGDTSIGSSYDPFR